MALTRLCASDEPEPAAPKPPSKAEREGAVAVGILKAVFRFENKGKMTEAQALRKTIPIGKVLGERAINNAAQDFEQRLFKIGFMAMFSTAIKPAADNYVLFREDHEHILKSAHIVAWRVFL